MARTSKRARPEQPLTLAMDLLEQTATGTEREHADVMKLVDMLVLEASGVTRVGSSPTVRTIAPPG